MRHPLLTTTGLALLLGAPTARAEAPSTAALSRICAERVEQRRYRDAIEACTKAEAAQHAPVHLQHLARAHEALGHPAEAAALRARAAQESAAQRPPEVIIESRLGRPAPAVLLSRLLHAGLPPDIALPHVRACAEPALAGAEPGARMEITLHVTASGAVSAVAARAQPRDADGKTARSAFTPQVLGCVAAALEKVHVARVSGSPPVVLRGSYVITRHAGKLLVVGRAREVGS